MPYHAPATVDEALSALAEPGARILAGGTDFYPALGERPIDFPVVDLSRVAALKPITTATDGSVRIGAAATWTDVIGAPLPPVFDALKEAARTVGSIQIQNTATLAGNLCNASPAADGVPPLLALGATVETAGPAGARRMPLAAFVTGVRETALVPGEMVTAILIPPHAPGSAAAFEKLGARKYLVISIAMVAVTIEPADGAVCGARVAVGSCSAVATRLNTLEQTLIGQPLTSAPDAVEAAHLTPLSPISDVRGTAEYRADAALELVRRAIARAVERTA